MYITQIIRAQVSESLKSVGHIYKIQQELEYGTRLDHNSDDGEDFHQDQNTQKEADFDKFTRLMKTNMEFSASILLENIGQVV